MTDLGALEEFASKRSSDAFAALVSAHMDLVYNTAWRLTADAHLADDVTQAVFMVLVRRAASINPRFISGWLVNTARLASRDALRSRKRRVKHEMTAATMRSEVSSTGEPVAEPQLAAVLDNALGRLNEADRSSIVLRFLQGKSFDEVGRVLGVSGETARKRVDRAIAKLRSVIKMTGPRPSAEQLGLSLTAFQTPTVPVDLLNRVMTLPASSAVGPVATIAKGVVWTMALAKVQIAAVALAIFVATIGVTLTGIVALRHPQDRSQAAPVAELPPPPLKTPHGDTAYDAAAKKSITNLKMFGLAMAMYRAEHGEIWPEAISDIKKNMPGYETAMRNPITGDSEGYIYKKPPDKIRTLPAAAITVVLSEAKGGAPDPDGAALYADDHIGKF